MDLAVLAYILELDAPKLAASSVHIDHGPLKSRAVTRRTEKACSSCYYILLLSFRNACVGNVSADVSVNNLDMRLRT